VRWILREDEVGRGELVRLWVGGDGVRVNMLGKEVAFVVAPERMIEQFKADRLEMDGLYISTLGSPPAGNQILGSVKE